LLASLASPSSLWAQQTKAPDSEGPAGSSLSGSAGTTPLPRYFPKENLVVYVEFSGLDAHADAWNKTAAYKMLTETPLGEMLEQVATQLLDKVLSYAPGHKFNGGEIITLFKYAAHHGFAMGFHIRPTSSDKVGDFLTITMVIRDGSSKEIRGLTSRLMGLTIANRKPRLEKPKGRTIVVLPNSRPDGATEVKNEGDSWWAEKDDLVLCSPYPAGVDRVFDALDGKVPSAVDHPIVQELARKDGTFEPAGIAFVDAAGCPKNGKTTEPFQKMVDVAGIHRIGLRWGFDDDALMRELRIVAPRPRKPFLALFDQPGFDGRAVMPLPEGVESFLELSIDPNALIDSIAQLGPEGAVKAKVDEFADAVRSSGKIDFRKDFLGHIGPRMVLFAAPDKSAAVAPGSFEANWLRGGFRPGMGIPTAALEHLPKVTVVAEITDPKNFGRTLEGAINALNHQLAEQTAELMEKADEEKAEPGAGTPGAGQGGGARAGGRAGGQRGGTRKRSPSSLAPKFQRMSSPESITAYILYTPADSPLKIGPPNFRPVIKLEGKHLVISVASDSADAALKAAQQKGWKPSDDLRKASEHLPPKMVVLGVTDPREVMPPFLASLPGTLQTIINSAITLARSQGANAGQGGTNPPAVGPGGPGMMAGRQGGRMMGRMGSGAAGPGGPGAAGPGGPGPGGPAADGNNNNGIPADAMVELKVDSDKLPKAEDLRSRYFLSTIAIAVADQDIRLITREAFVSQTDMALSGVSVALLLPAVQAARAAARRAQEANQAAAEAAQAPAAGPGPGAAGPAGPGRPGGAGGAGMPGRGGGRRGRPGG
jgi:hypothetical protein